MKDLSENEVWGVHFQFFLQILYWLRIITLNMISWLRQIFIWTDIRKRISFTVWYLEILKNILVIAICMLETFFKMMWRHWFTVPVKFSSYHWNLICTEYSWWNSGKVLNFTNTDTDEFLRMLSLHVAIDTTYMKIYSKYFSNFIIGDGITQPSDILAFLKGFLCTTSNARKLY